MKRAILLIVPFLASACALVVARESDGRTRVIANPDGRSDDLPYSHGVLANGTYYVAGTIGIDPDTGLPPEDVREEIVLLLDGIKAKLALVDMDMDDIVSVQVFCTDLELYGTFNEIYATYFDGEYPSRAFIGSGPLLRGGRFEMNAVAVRH